MKKFFALVVSLILILSLTACGGSDSSTDSAPDSGASSADPAAKTEIVYGKSQGPYTELFEAAIVPILEEQGYTLKGVDLFRPADCRYRPERRRCGCERGTAHGIRRKL